MAVATSEPPPVFRTRELARDYRIGDAVVHALGGVDLAVAAGEVVLVAGPSGSGKSTLLHLLGTLDRPDRGAVEIEGVAVARLSERERTLLRRRRLGFVFQSFHLVPVLTALENAEFTLLLRGVPEAERRARVTELFARIGMGGLEDRRPAKLSGGQQQRVAVARAVVGRPAIVLADEPTANLDSATSEALLDVMEQLNREERTTFVFSTHDPRVMRRARRLVTLVDGAIAGDERKAPPTPA